MNLLHFMRITWKILENSPELSMKQVDKNIYQYGDYSFQVKMMVAGNKASKVFDTLPEARTWRDLQRAGAALDHDEARIFEARVKKREAQTFTVRQALDKYMKEITPTKKGADVEEDRINKTKRTKLANKSLYMVKPSDVLDFLDEIGGSDNNKRKYASLISHMYRTAAKRWSMSVENPVAGKIEMPSNGKPRDRRLEGNESTIILKHLTEPARSVVVFAIETAARQGEILEIRWKNVDLKSRVIFLTDTKNGESRAVPLSTVAIETIKSQPRGIGDSTVFRITKSQLRKAWEKARHESGCPDLRFHDLRHEAASRLFEKGLNVMEAASVTGHKTLGMLKRYTHLNPTELAKKLG